MKTLCVALTLVAFVTFGGFGMFAVVGTDGHHHTPGCPFMPGEQAVCDMTALEHIIAWQKGFTVTVPMLFVYLLAIIVLFVWKYKNPLECFVRRMLPQRLGEYIPVPLYQELFSRGILNPKAP